MAVKENQNAFTKTYFYSIKWNSGLYTYIYIYLYLYLFIYIY